MTVTVIVMASKKEQHQSLHHRNLFRQEYYALNFPVVISKKIPKTKETESNNFGPNGMVLDQNWGLGHSCKSPQLSPIESALTTKQFVDCGISVPERNLSMEQENMHYHRVGTIFLGLKILSSPVVCL